MGERIIQVSEVNYIVEVVETPPHIVQVVELEPSVDFNSEINVRVEISPPILNVVEAAEIKKTVQISQTEIQVVETGIPGPPGPPGTGGDLITSNYSAGEPLGGQRVVIVWFDGLLYYADATKIAHFNRVLGITVGAIEADSSGIVRIGGFMTEPTWNWQPDKFIYLGTNGFLTQNPPATGFLLEIGQPISPTKILVDIKFPVLMA